MVYSATMRSGLAFILAVMLSLNAAYAASVGMCDALEHSSSHAEHFGHHSHEHGDDHDHDVPQLGADGMDKVNSIGDHHHDHAHPSFSSILPNIVSVTPLSGCSLLVAAPVGTFISAPQSLPDHPPGANLA